ncbi:MAG: hypothetical protein VKJ06_06000 [Vampirovibrionales bacterium]|nr:hypothetical protein [Vampirovibrionales bacterium]
MPLVLKYTLWFMPLCAGFIALGLLVNDLRHPARAERACTVLALGPNVPKLLNQPSPIYATGRGPQHNIGLTCAPKGQATDAFSGKEFIGGLQRPEKLWVNDETPFALGSGVGLGDAVVLREIRYRWIPKQWRLTIQGADA